MASTPDSERAPGARAIRPLALVAFALLSACSAPPVQPPVPSVPLAAAFGHGRTAGTETGITNAAWWAGRGDPTLTAVVEEALAANQDIAIALQRGLWPTMGVQASASRSSSSLPDPVKQGMPDTRALRTGIDVAFTGLKVQ